MKVTVQIFLLALAIGQLPVHAQQAQKEAEKEDRYAEARKDAERVTVLMNGKEQKLNPKPLYTFDDNTRSWTDASSWVWGAKGRPVALMGMSTSRGFTRFNEYASFSKYRLNVDTGYGAKWTPPPGWDPKPIPGAPKPAKTPRGRLLQMRHLAKQFTAKQFESSDGYHLRLLPTPIHRYGESEESLDGAFFAFVREQDMETVLAIDAEKQKDGTSRWVFDCKPQSGNDQEVYRKKEVVWSTKRASQGPAFPYFIFIRRVR